MSRKIKWIQNNESNVCLCVSARTNGRVSLSICGLRIPMVWQRNWYVHKLCPLKANNNNTNNMYIHFNTKHSLRLPTRHLTGIVMLFLFFHTQFTYIKSHTHTPKATQSTSSHSLTRQTVIYNICTEDNLSRVNFYVSTLDLLCESFCSSKSQCKYNVWCIRFFLAQFSFNLERDYYYMCIHIFYIYVQ